MIEIKTPQRPIYDELYGIDTRYRNEIDRIKAQSEFFDKCTNVYDRSCSDYKVLRKYEIIEDVLEKLKKCNCYCKKHLEGWFLGIIGYVVFSSVVILPIVAIIVGLLVHFGVKSDWIIYGLYIPIVPVGCYLLYIIGLTLALLFTVITIPLLNWIGSDRNLEKKFISSNGAEREVLIKVLKIRENRRYALKMKEYNAQMDILEKDYPGFKKVEGDVVAYNRVVFYENIEKFIETLKGIINECNLKYTKEWWERILPNMFEKEVANWFIQKGYEADITKYSGDGGVDIVLRKNGQREFVQCKHYLEQKVQVATVRELFGVMSSENIHKGYIVSLFGMTQAACEFANKNNIASITVEELSSNASRNKYKTETKVQFDEILSFSPNIVRVHVGDCYIYEDVFDNILSARQELDKKNYLDRWCFVISSGKGGSKVYYTIASCPLSMKDDIQKVL